jgi:hypothetical protein
MKYTAVRRTLINAYAEPIMHNRRFHYPQLPMANVGKMQLERPQTLP